MKRHSFIPILSFIIFGGINRTILLFGGMAFCVGERLARIFFLLLIK
ncbi:MAG: hypothetical protein HY811_03815 [Planctomycetes bacterium]|nr:hypothetical protein [Planctomycetota bacterium]